VENQVGTVRDLLFRTRPRAKTLDELNVWLADQCVAYATRTKHPEFKDRTIFEVFEEERAKLMPYLGPFAGFVEKPMRATTTCLIAHEVAVGLLLNQLDQGHSLVGCCRLRFRFQVLQPEPSRRSAMTASVTVVRALRYADGSARGLLHHHLGHDRPLFCRAMGKTQGSGRCPPQSSATSVSGLVSCG